MKEILSKAIKDLEESNSPLKRFVILPAVKDELNKLEQHQNESMKIYTQILNNGKREILWVDENGQPRKSWNELTEMVTEYPDYNHGAIELFKENEKQFEEISEEICSILMSQIPIQLTVNQIQDLMYLATCEYDMNESERTGMSKVEGVQRFIKRILNERLFNK